MRTNTVLILTVVFLIIISAAAVFFVFSKNDNKVNDDDNDKTITNEEDNTQNDDTQDVTQDEDANLPDYTIQLSNYNFMPNILTATPGQKLTIKLENNEGSHDFVIDALNIKSKKLSGNQSETIEIAIPEDSAGKDYEFYCSMSNHRQMGMIGTLQIIAD